VEKVINSHDGPGMKQEQREKEGSFLGNFSKQYPYYLR
jgi:hypothetical protein